MQEKNRDFSITNSLIKSKLIQYLNYKGIAKKEMYEKTGITSGVFSQNNGLSEDNLMRFLNYYNDLNTEWLFFGKGSLIKKEGVEDKRGIPLVNQEAIAGFGNAIFRLEESDILARYVIPDFESVDFMMRVTGKSMEPSYNSGDIIACRIIKERNFIQWNRVHVIATDNQGILIKRLKKCSDAEALTAISDNSEYEPFEVPLQEIQGIALVIGVMRLE